MKYLIFALCFLFIIPVVMADELPPLQSEIYNARDKVMPALVHIQPVITDFRTGKMQKQAIVGSGVIFDEEGYIVTNYHVAGKAERIICTLNDKEQVKAELIGGDPLTDIAVIKLDLTDYKGKLTAVEFGNSNSIEVGQYVLAMGSPLALARSVSYGVISTIDRYFPVEARLPSGERTGIYNNWIQTDAAINPGNSGGPLVDLNGRVIGINTRVILMANNIGFSIPINIVKEVINSILTKGKVVRSWIGVQCQALMDLEGWFGTSANEGVLVVSVDPKSPAQEAGLQAGDIIMKLNDKPVSARFTEQLPAFYKKIADLPIGSLLELTVLRGDQTIYLEVATHELGEVTGEDLECEKWAFTVKAITKQMAVENQLEDTLGVFVTGVKRVGPAADAGLRQGDVIKGVNEDSTLSFEDFYNKYQELSENGTEKVLLTVKRTSTTKFLLLRVEEQTSMDSNN